MKKEMWNASFTFLFSSKAVKVFGDHLAGVSMMWLLLELGGNAMDTSVMYVMAMVPVTILGVFVSPILQKWTFNKWMFVSDFVRAFLLFSVPILFYMDSLPLWYFYGVAFIQSTCGAFYNPSAVALLPQLIKKTYLQAANAFIVSSEKTIYLLGLAAAGAFITWFTAPVTILITSGVFLLSALLLLGIRPHFEGDEESIDVSEKYFASIKRGFLIIRHHEMLAPMVIISIFLNIGITPWIVLRPVILYDDLHVSAAWYASVSACGFVGGVVIGLLLAKFHVKRQGILFIGAILVEGVSLLFTGVFPTLLSLMVCAFIIGMSETAINVPVMVLLQSLVPSHQLPLVYSSVAFVSGILLPFAGLAIGPLAVMYGNSSMLIVGSVLMLVSSAFAVLTKLRKAEIPKHEVELQPSVL